MYMDNAKDKREHPYSFALFDDTVCFSLHLLR